MNLLRRALMLGFVLLLAGGPGCTKKEPPPVRRAGITLPSLEEGWKRIDGNALAMRAGASTGDLHTAAAQAREVADMTLGLLPLSTSYTAIAAPEGPLTYAVNDMDRLAGDVQAAADAGDREAAVDAVLKMRRSLRHIHGLYPPGVLPEMLPD